MFWELDPGQDSNTTPGTVWPQPAILARDTATTFLRRVSPLTISVTCSQCGTTLKVKDELAGKRGKCPKCQGAVQIPPLASRSAVTGTATVRPQATSPAVDDNATSATADERRAQVLDTIGGEIERPKAPFSFRLRLTLAACAVCLLHSLYAGLILLFAGFAVAWFLQGPRFLAGTTGLGQAILHYGPVLAGLLIALALLKPLLAPRPSKGKAKALARDKAPLLFELVEKVAAVIGAEPPSQIQIDCNPALQGSRSRLLIGLPLVAGASVQQLAGMIAHECGRHVRGTAAGTADFLRRNSGFYYRAVKERDAWDEAVHAATTSRRSHVGKLLWPLRLLFGLVKVLLWPLMYLARMLSGLLLQKTEYDADLCQIRLIGSRSFEATFRSLRVIDFAWQQVRADLVFQRKENQLPDNLPRQLQSAIAQVPEDFRAGLAVQGDATETADFALIPAEKDRLAAARSAAASGIYSCPLPATVLFHDFNTLAKEVTWDYYLVELGPPLERRFLQPVV